ncbi:hypothetical protein [Aureimonas fodinaquatilis]|uniref:hypothetical protein n=1 Tax=Aureimonas fodinaquatilis TaxID=2565783 RepID=UPI001FE4A6F7|nr:hypothetical protein [Aureimonas fodinaquatilis]
MTALMDIRMDQLTAAALPAGELVGRPDLTEQQVLQAIAERLAFEGRHGPEPAVVLLAARIGKRKALAFLRKLVLPPRVATLEMPERPIMRSHYSAVSHSHLHETPAN